MIADGISLGGEAAATLADIGQRVTHVATIGASPDWTSPGMHGVGDPAELLPPGDADSYCSVVL